MASIERAFNALLDPVTGGFVATPEKLSDFLSKYPNAPTDMLEATRNQLAAYVYGEDLTPEQMKGLNDEQADRYIAQLKALVNEDGSRREDLITEEFYNSYVDPEIKEFESVLGAYRAEAERINNETYQKQMAGDKAIEVDGKERYVAANAVDGDVEAFMEDNKEAVVDELEKLGYGNTKNPNIPDKTVIRVDGVDLLYNKSTNTWHYIEANQRRTDGESYNLPKVTIRGKQYAANDASAWVVHGANGGRTTPLNPVRKKDAEFIRLEFGENTKDGTVAKTENGREVVSFYGKWYYLK
jgi:hypothetical protein